MSATNRIDCPCCGKTKVEEYDICDVCGWENDPVQSFNHERRGANKMTLPEAQRAYAEGRPVKQPTSESKAVFNGNRSQKALFVYPKLSGMTRNYQGCVEGTTRKN